MFPEYCPWKMTLEWHGVTIHKLSYWAELFKAGLKQPRVSARFEFSFESLKSISVLILFVYKLMIRGSKNNREHYPRKCF